MNQRLTSFFIDFLTYFGISSLLLHLATVLLPGEGDRMETLQNLELVPRISIMLTVHFLSWFIVFVLPTRRHGQTFGMRMLKCKLLDYDNLKDNPTTKNLLKRELFSLGIPFPPIAIFVVATTFMDRSHRNVLDKWSKTIFVSLRKEKNREPVPAEE